MASSSMARTLKGRERFVHISKPLVTVLDKAGVRSRIADPKPGRTLNLGRNKAKRALRIGARKCWLVLPRGA